MTDQNKTATGRPAMHSIPVVSVHSKDDDDAESFRVWAWHAVAQAGGDVTISYRDFLNTPGATLSWSIDPATLDLRIVAGRQEEANDGT